MPLLAAVPLLATVLLTVAAGWSGSTMLTAAQLQQFRDDGVLILPDFVNAKQLESWRAQTWELLGADPHDSSSWPRGAVGGSARQPMLVVQPSMGELPQFREIMGQLGAGTLEAAEAGSPGGGAMIKAIFPSGDAQTDCWLAEQVAGIRAAADDPVEQHRRGRALHAAAQPTPGLDGDGNSLNGHIDSSGNHRLGVTLYLDDVREGGGCFTFWRGGHRRIHEFFLQHPEWVGPSGPWPLWHDPDSGGGLTSWPPFVERGWTAAHDLCGTVAPTGPYGRADAVGPAPRPGPGLHAH